jgi:hypothetical protein
MPLGALLCPLGLFMLPRALYAPWGSSTCPPLRLCAPPYMCASWGSFISLGALICPLRNHLCFLGLKCTPPPPSRVHAPLSNIRAPPYVCAPWGSFIPFGALVCPLGGHLWPLGLSHGPWGSFKPPRAYMYTPPQECVPPPMCTSLPYVHKPPLSRLSRRRTDRHVRPSVRHVR